MRLIRRLMLLTIVGVGGVAAFNYWSQNGWPARPRAAALEAQIAKQQAARLATRAAAKANDAASKVGDTVSDSALTAKIKSRSGRNLRAARHGGEESGHYGRRRRTDSGSSSQMPPVIST